MVLHSSSFSLPNLLRLLLAMWLVFPALATAQVEDNFGTVRLDGRALFRVGPTAELEARPRARQIEQQLQAVLETPQAIRPARIQPAEGGQGRLVTVAGRTLLSVSAEDAEANALSLETLARDWAAVIDDALARALERRGSERGRFVTGVRASVETAFARLVEAGISIIPRGLAVLVVILVFWGLAAGVRQLVHMLSGRMIRDRTVENLIKQVSYYAIWLMGLVVAAYAFGVEPGSLATGLGLTSLALGFALKDILSNFVSGLLILTLRPFELGDQIIIGETEGSVERIELRATQIRTYDGRRVLVPNAEIFTSRVTNNTAAPVRRGKVLCHFEYQDAPQEVIRLLSEAAQATPGVMADPPVTVRVHELAKADVIYEVCFWADSRRSDFVLTASQIRGSIIRALQQARQAAPRFDS
ncbi:mechanosensitive ion channel family protein [Stutzerimonas tarimensis]|uniref:Small-conductance mechanosensitive channel n=1 Tax=Stutzerimonas tarimensis TaxID=1507735 RepID=A0ABV7T6W4_9GAMM